jgi:SRSO17 transposase
VLQGFFSRSDWDEDKALERHQKRVAAELGGPDGIFVIDETSDAKKGDWTAGVSRQYCGESGKLDNCIVSVHTGYVREQRHCLLDGELFLPESWNPDPADERVTARRQRAKVPEDVVHRSKTELALDQIKRALAHGVAGRYVTADELYGGAPWWRAELARLGLVYVVEVPARVCGWIDERQGEAGSLAGLAASHRRLRRGRQSRYTTHETDKGPEVWTCRRVKFIEQAAAAPNVYQSLLVVRNVRTAEQKFFLTNAPRTLSTPACLKVAFARWRIERCFQDCKGELGLNHAEIRTYRGLHRHFILTAINYYFLQNQVRRQGEKRSDRVAAGRCDSSDRPTPPRGHHDTRADPAAGRSVGRGDGPYPVAQSRRTRLGQTSPYPGVG